MTTQKRTPAPAGIAGSPSRSARPRASRLHSPEQRGLHDTTGKEYDQAAGGRQRVCAQQWRLPIPRSSAAGTRIQELPGEPDDRTPDDQRHGERRGVRKAGPDAPQEVPAGLSGAARDERGYDHADQPGDGLLDRLLAQHSVDGEEDGGCDGRANRRTQSSEGVHHDEDHGRNRSDHRAGPATQTGQKLLPVLLPVGPSASRLRRSVVGRIGHDSPRSSYHGL